MLSEVFDTADNNILLGKLFFIGSDDSALSPETVNMDVPQGSQC